MAAPEPKPEFLTTREVAALLRVRERKVYDMAAAGEIPCRRVTGKLLFPSAEIEAWLAGGQSAPTARPEPHRATANVVAGSHDPLLDWAIRASGSGLATFFDGSLDGLERLGRGEAAAAGLHVYEPDRDDWNIAHVETTLTDGSAALVEWAKRSHGLIVAAGDTAIAGFSDLAGKRIVRRQPSAGAAILFLHLLARAGLKEADVRFLDDTARTETEAASAVAAGEADAAPGLEAVAHQFGLGFVPLATERFDLAVDRRAWFEPPLQTLMTFAGSDAFAAKARALGGYDISGLGTVRWNAPG